MKTFFWVVVIVVVLGGAYWWVGRPGVGAVTVTLSEQNASGETGTAVLEEVDGAVRVTLTVLGQPAGVVQPAHIHTGTCADLGGVVYPLTFPQDGAASVTQLEASLANLQGQGPLAVNVHKSVAEASVYVACGDIEF